MRIVSRTKTVKERDLTVEIGKKTDPQTLTLDMAGDEPVVLSQSGNAQDVYEPYRLGTCTIKLAFKNEGMLKMAVEWMAGLSYNEAPVVVKLDGDIVFAGYVNPNIRQVDYSSVVTVLEVNAYDMLASLQYKEVQGGAPIMLRDLLEENPIGDTADETKCDIAFMTHIKPWPIGITIDPAALRKSDSSAVSMLDVLTEVAKITGMTWIQVPEKVFQYKNDGEWFAEGESVIALTDMALAYEDTRSAYRSFFENIGVEVKPSTDLPKVGEDIYDLTGHSRGSGDRLSVYAPYTDYVVNIKRQKIRDMKDTSGETIDASDVELISFDQTKDARCNTFAFGLPVYDTTVEGNITANMWGIHGDDSIVYCEYSARSLGSQEYGNDMFTVCRLQSRQTNSSAVIDGWGYGEGGATAIEDVYIGMIDHTQVPDVVKLFRSSGRSGWQKNSSQPRWMNESAVNSTYETVQPIMEWREDSCDSAALLRIGTSTEDSSSPDFSLTLKDYLVLNAGARDLKQVKMITSGQPIGALNTVFTYSYGWVLKAVQTGNIFVSPYDDSPDHPGYPSADDARQFVGWLSAYGNKKMAVLGNSRFRERDDRPVAVKLTHSSRLVLSFTVTYPQLLDMANMPGLKGNLGLGEFRTLGKNVMPMTVPFMMTLKVGEYFIGHGTQFTSWTDIETRSRGSLKWSKSPIIYLPRINFERSADASARTSNQSSAERSARNGVNFFDRTVGNAKGLDIQFDKIKDDSGRSLRAELGYKMPLYKNSVEVTIYEPLPMNNIEAGGDEAEDGFGFTNFAWVPKKLYISDLKLRLVCGEADVEAVEGKEDSEIVYRYQKNASRMESTHNVMKSELNLTLEGGYGNSVYDTYNLPVEIVDYHTKKDTWLQMQCEELLAWKYAKTYMERACESISKTFDFDKAHALMSYYWEKMNRRKPSPSSVHYIGQAYVDLPEDIQLSTAARTLKAGRYWQTSMFRYQFELYYTRTSNGVWLQKYDTDIQHYTGLIWDGADIWYILYIKYTEGHWQVYCGKSGGSTDINILSPVDEVLHMGGVIVYESDAGQRLYFSGEGYAQQHKELGLYVDSNDSRVPYELVFSTNYEYGKYQGVPVTVLREVQSSTDLRREAVNAELVLVDQIYQDVMVGPGKYEEK